MTSPDSPGPDSPGPGGPGAGRRVRIAFSVADSDLGEITRALELARGLRAHAPAGWTPEITFLTHSDRSAATARGAGFAVHDSEPRFAGIGFREDLQSQEPEFIGSADLARDLVVGVRSALAEVRPDVVVHGFWPAASVAARMLGIPRACFLSLPMHPDVLGARHVLSDVPDPMRALTYLPRPVRRALAGAIPGRLVLRVPMFRQRNVRLGAEAAGWQGEPLEHIWDMLRADLTVVNDLPDFYARLPLPPGYRITGPLFAPSAPGARLRPEIDAVFADGSARPRVFCTMGSSTRKEQLLEAVRALTTGRAAQWNTVILVPPSICSLAEERDRAGEAPRAVLTDAFVPAPAVNALADVVVSHGGQGTVQTAVTSGTPVVGFGVQTEQQINLDHLVDAGAALRVPLHRWKAATIQRAVARVIDDPRYRRRAQALQQRFLAVDGRRRATEAVWDWIAVTDPRHGTPFSAGDGVP